MHKKETYVHVYDFSTPSLFLFEVFMGFNLHMYFLSAFTIIDNLMQKYLPNCDKNPSLLKHFKQMNVDSNEILITH